MRAAVQSRRLIAGSCRFQRVGFSVVVLGFAASLAAAEPAKRIFNIEAKPATQSLTDYARQARTQLGYDVDIVDNILTNAVVGEYDPAEALELLLEDTGLEAEHGKRGIFIRRVAKREVSGDIEKRTPPVTQTNSLRFARASAAEVHATVGQNQTTRRTGTDSSEGEKERPLKERPLEEIIVTGTNIRGVAPDSSPVWVFNREDISRTGFGTLQQFVQSLPQNFGGGSNADIPSLPNDRAASNNNTAGSSVNLRGLGSGSTLVLLNGGRLAPAGSIGDFVDISMIPLSVVDRIEMVTDGASAIYGADAIAGVVNFVLREDYDGAETFVRYGTAAGGKMNAYRAGQSFGKNWDSGNALASYEFYHRDNLGAEDRDFSSGALLPTDLLPKQETHNVLFSASQELIDGAKIYGHGIYSQRDSNRARQTSVLTDSNVAADSEQVGGSVRAEVDLWSAWQLNSSVLYHKVSAFADTTGRFPFQRQTDSDVWSINTKLDGKLLDMPSGESKLAVGFEYREETFETTSGNAVLATEGHDRNATSTFAEVFIPIIGQSNERVGAKRIELTVAGRFDDYSDFGSTWNPKFGALWSPFKGFVLRGTYGTSFNPPNLGDLGIARGSLVAASLPDPASPTGSSVVLIDERTVPNLGPEEATTWTAGFDLEFDREVNIFAFSLTVFDINYSGRINSPSTTLSAILPNEATFSEVIFRNPDIVLTSALVTEAMSQGRFLDFSFGAWSMPGDEDVLINNGLQNLSRTDTRGLEFNIDYSRNTDHGAFGLGLNGNYLFELERGLAETSPVFDEVDLVFNPVDLRMRGNAYWSKGGVNANVFVNYTDGYTDNRNVLGLGDVPVQSWTTVDLNFSYDTAERPGSRWLDNTQISLSVLNVLDSEPPAIAMDTFSLTGFDPTNADPRGRFIAFQITKGW